MKEYIVKTSSILVEEFTIEAKSSDEARDNTFDSWIEDSEGEDEEGKGKED